MDLRAIKGMNDILPNEIGRWHRLEHAFRRMAELHHYEEVRTPLVESTSLFVRSIGETTDIVEKEMYSFEKHGDRLTLRPEGTAGAARAYIEHSVHAKEPVTRWYYLGPMFRAERPQRGRHRQFYQGGCEVFGDPGPAVDAEMIDMLVHLLEDLGIKGTTVLLNSLGGPGTRARYRDALVAHLSPQKETLSDDSKRRLDTNPLRILDSKDPRDVEAISHAPAILDVLEEADREHLAQLRRHLDKLGTPYTIEPKLVRGLDYYTRTLFELRGAGGQLGSQNALLGGGRYDGMVKDLGGPAMPAIGFALGIERLLLAMPENEVKRESCVFVAALGAGAADEALLLSRELRAAGVVVELDARGGSLKSMLRRANAMAVAHAFIVGEAELARGVVQLKDLEKHTQEDLPRAEAARILRGSRGVATRRRWCMKHLCARASVILGLLLGVLVFGARPALAQMPMMGQPNMPSQRRAPAPNPKEPQTHAASGAADDEIPKVTGTEPSLPADPLAIPPEVKKQIGSDADTDRELGRGPTTTRTWAGLWYSEKSGDYSFRALFPLWAERRQPNDRASLFGPIYFNRRSKDHDADILFPIFWNLRDKDNHATIAGPIFHRRAPGESDDWVAPLVFSGKRPDGGYLHIPPLLTFTHHDKDGGFNLIGPGFCSWKGGQSCSASTADDIDYGIAPRFFAGRSERARYEFVPPLLHYYRSSELDNSSLNVWGPFIWKHERDHDVFDVAPLFWHYWGKNEDHVTLLPFFHYGYSGNSSLFINPLFLTARGEHGETTFASWLYARYRGRTELDMVTPFFWRYADPDIHLTRIIIPPFVYSSQSPRSTDFALFPFWAHFKEPGISETVWVTPFFQHTHDLEGWQTNIHPLLYLGRTNDATHTVVFPFFWDFASPGSRTTVGFPIYWRIADENTVSQLVLNTYYHEHRVGNALDWEFHFFPAFSYGETPDGHWWNVLFGLAGYTRRGAMTQVRALWVPITLTDAAGGP